MPVLQLGYWVTRRVTCPRTGGGGWQQSQEWQPACLRFGTLPRGYLPEEQTSPSCWKQPMETFPSTLPKCLFLLILQSQFHLPSPFLLAALPCELPHLAGSMSWLPVRQLVTSFSLKLTWKSLFYLFVTAAKHSMGHHTGGCCVKGCHKANRQILKLLSESDTAANFVSLALLLSEQLMCQTRDKWGGFDSMASRNEVVTPSISVTKAKRDCTKANDGNTLNSSSTRNYLSGYWLWVIWASLWGTCPCV